MLGETRNVIIFIFLLFYRCVPRKLIFFFLRWDGVLGIEKRVEGWCAARECTGWLEPVNGVAGVVDDGKYVDCG